MQVLGTSVTKSRYQPKPPTHRLSPKRHTPEKLRRPRRDEPPFPAQAERAAFAPTMMPSGEAEHILQMDYLCCRLKRENSGVWGLVASGTSQSYSPLGKEDT